MLYLVLFSLIISSGAEAKNSCKRIVCLVHNLDVPKDFIAKHIPTDYCTHIIYQYAKIEGNNLKNMFSYELFNGRKKGLYAKFNGLKRTNSHLKTLLRVTAPWGKTEPFHKMADTKENRREFIDAAIAFLKKHQFDGLDVDWRYPTTNGGSEKDKPNFSAFLKEAFEEFQKNSVNSGLPRLLLSATVHPYLLHFYDVHELARYTDMVNVIGFYLRGPWDAEMDHHSPLHDWFGMAKSMENWVANGMPADKLNLGISFNGLYAHVESKTNHSRLGKIVNVERPLYTPYSSGVLPFREICNLTSDQNFLHIDATLKAPYFFRDGLWLGYDDKSSVYEKGKYAMEHGHGVWVQTLQWDDYDGTMCEMGKYPLLTSVYSGCAM
ncbi:unnamed protein product [Lymnaea stagnalis]|uniref:GH18 domain-containing protein n=1 Tax=Lymnaea stagnalis TaxID=6523 RepID=A0AAV2H482_LYMST